MTTTTTTEETTMTAADDANVAATVYAASRATGRALASAITAAGKAETPAEMTRPEFEAAATAWAYDLAAENRVRQAQAAYEAQVAQVARLQAMGDDVDPEALRVARAEAFRLSDLLDEARVAAEAAQDAPRTPTPSEVDRALAYASAAREDADRLAMEAQRADQAAREMEAEADALQAALDGQEPEAREYAVTATFHRADLEALVVALEAGDARLARDAAHRMGLYYAAENA